MKILHFSTSDSEGGSARSARRLHQSLRRRGHVSRMLVGTRASEDADAATVHGGGMRRILDRLAEEATRRVGLQYVWYPSGRRVRRHPWVAEADIVQLYNLHGGYLSLGLLPALARRAAIVWRLSDMWAMTGHCAYAGPCERWQAGCGRCPDLASYPPLAFDTSALLWRRKRRLYAMARPTIVAPSRWIEDLARQSPLFAGCAVHHIATAVDTAVYRPIPRLAAREILDLPKEQQLILFAAHSVDDDARKGSGAAVAALQRIPPRQDLAVLLLGGGGERWQGRIPHPVFRLGFIRDERLLAAAYTAADLALAPASVENLPNAILEAMACGTPVVAFATGGIGEAVRHRETGWLAPPGDDAALADGIRHLLADTEERARLSAAGIALTRTTFSADREASEFLALYERLRAARAAA
ncbi:MAG TPA: glycosyltransferase family 4 protein [Stellaceae bacterium]|nr:glycosyltransferase family 4 protein [Stellaceae bacterium]